MKFIPVLAIVLLSTSLQAQTFRRQAALLGGGGDRGRCTVEMVVDGAAEIAFRSDDATVTNLKGQMPEIRRFECTSPIPGNPIEFRYEPRGGRGRQQLLRPAADGQPAVIRIEDPQNGSDRYAFEFSWRAQFQPPPPPDRRDRRRSTTDEAIDLCRREVRRQVADRFRTDPDRVDFREIRIDDNPGRRDWVIGTLEVRRDRDTRRGEAMRFSCSVDFETGRVRNAQVDPIR